MDTTNPSVLHAQRDRDGLATIGRTKHQLMGIRYVEGEGGAAPAAPTAPAAPVAPAAPAVESKPPWGDDPTKFDPDKAWKLIENLRKDADERQAKTDAAIAAAADKAQKDALSGLAKLLTGEQEPETDPAKLNAALTDLKGQVSTATASLTEAQATVKDTQRALQVALLAPTLGADPTKLLAHEAFKTAIASAEPTDQAAIQAEITKAIQATPTLKATPPRSGGGEHQGATVQPLEAQLKAAQEKGNQAEVIRLTREVVHARRAVGA